MKLAIIAAALAMLPIAPAFAEAAPARVAVVVAIKTPPGIDDARLRAEFEKSVPVYRQIPGLIRKYYTILPSAPGALGRFGGIYYWSSRAAADAWFSDAWRARVIATYGSAAELSFYDVPTAIEGAKP